MKFQQRKQIFLKLWGWICLSLNCLIVATFLSDKNAKFLGVGIIISIAMLGYGVIKTYRDKIMHDFSGVSLAIQYVCTYIITLIMSLKASDYLASLIPIKTLAIASLLEMIVFLAIIWFRFIKRIIFSFIGINRK